jgi:prepilin-type N-terminal cleavage/methylation domain-containing protein
MKTTKSDQWQVAGGVGDDVLVAPKPVEGGRSLWHPSRSSLVTSAPTKRHSHAQRGLQPLAFSLQPSRHAFTLIELLVVIAIMATLAALLLPVVGAVKKHQYIYNAQSEMAKLETAIDRYKAAYGFYPPDNHLIPIELNQALINQLYYELVGTTNTGTTASPTYQTLDNSLPTPLSGGDVGDVHNAFGVGGFMNSTKPNGGEDASAAKNFLPDLKPNQIWPQFTNNTVLIKLLVCSVGGPDNTYQPLGAPGLNPWRYVCPGTNNSNSYDLWVQLGISGKTNLICNWNQSVQTGSPVP